jgi:recX family
MYKILKITKKLNGNFNLYIKDYKDEKVEVHLETLYSYKLLSKKEMDEKEFEEMMSENEKKLAKQKALKTLSMANKTKKELILKLKQSKFSTEAIDYAMTFVDKYDFIDEENIAKTLVEGKYSKKRYSKRAMISKLRQKGISSDVIGDSIKDIGDDEEFENAMYFAQKKLRTIRDDDKYKVRNKLMSALSYRGFSYDIIKRVSENILKDFGQEDEYYDV